jgi:hypothetical protein
VTAGTNEEPAMPIKVTPIEKEGTAILWELEADSIYRNPESGNPSCLIGPHSPFVTGNNGKKKVHFRAYSCNTIRKIGKL